MQETTNGYDLPAEWAYIKILNEKLLDAGGQQAVNSCTVDILTEQENNRNAPGFTEAEYKTGERTFLSLRMDNGSSEVLTKCFRGAVMVMSLQKAVRDMAWMEYKGAQYRHTRDELFEPCNSSRGG